MAAAVAGPSRLRTIRLPSISNESGSRPFMEREEALYTALLLHMSMEDVEGPIDKKGKAPAGAIPVSDTEVALRLARKEAQAAARFDADQALAITLSSTRRHARVWDGILSDYTRGRRYSETLGIDIHDRIPDDDHEPAPSGSRESGAERVTNSSHRHRRLPRCHRGRRYFFLSSQESEILCIDVRDRTSDEEPSPSSSRESSASRVATISLESRTHRRRRRSRGQRRYRFLSENTDMMYVRF